MGTLFRLPDEIILTPLLQQFPCREHQIRSLAALVHVRFDPPLSCGVAALRLKFLPLLTSIVFVLKTIA